MLFIFYFLFPQRSIMDQVKLNIKHKTERCLWLSTHLKGDRNIMYTFTIVVILVETICNVNVGKYFLTFTKHVAFMKIKLRSYSENMKEGKLSKNTWQCDCPHYHQCGYAIHCSFQQFSTPDICIGCWIPRKTFNEQTSVH